MTDDDYPSTMDVAIYAAELNVLIRYYATEIAVNPWGYGIERIKELIDLRDSHDARIKAWSDQANGRAELASQPVT